MPLLSSVEHEQVEHRRVEREPVERGLDLLIREARRRQRRRRLRLALLTLTVCGSAAFVTAAANGWLAELTDSRAARGMSASSAATRCPESTVRFVSNATFSASVIGTGRVRLGIGNVYEPNGRRFLVYNHRSGSWGGIEAIWWVPRPAARGPILVRGVPLGKQGPIDLQPSDGGQAPGAGPLTLSGPSDAYPAYAGAASSGAVYAGSLWVRAGGCYAIDFSGRGLRERLVLDVVTRAGPYRPPS